MNRFKDQDEIILQGGKITGANIVVLEEKNPQILGTYLPSYIDSCNV